MEIDPPHDSDGSTNGSKENESYPVSDNSSGLGYPYAPEDFPNPGDKWTWKVGKRVNVSGFFMDRYLYLPAHLQKEFKAYEFKSRGFASKSSVERFLLEAFPGMDIKAFFDSFIWKIPAGKVTGNKEFVPVHTNCIQEFDPAGCKAGNITCSSLVETADHTMECDMCCIEPRFCRECCCILCNRAIKSANSDHSVIRCEAILAEGLICGHIAHIECGLRSYMAGTVGGTIGLDAEYYCRRCDTKTDLVPHVKNLLESCDFFRYDYKMEKILNMCVLILRGSRKTSAKTLLQEVHSAVAKLKQGTSYEDASAITTGEPDTLEVSHFKEPSQCVSFDYETESSKL